MRPSCTPPTRWARRNLLQAIAEAAPGVRKVLLASSANVYGNTDADPIGEDVPPAPVNHYACSKLAMEFIARTWFDRLPIVITRPFNYTGPGQTEAFLIPKLVAHRAGPAAGAGTGQHRCGTGLFGCPHAGRCLRAAARQRGVGHGRERLLRRGPQPALADWTEGHHRPRAGTSRRGARRHLVRRAGA
ncbi:MAG: GDP-mannose 4,6-dehydratase [Comamonadaceae bacterium]|nr:GDP-mannose 4,6-dehydratase [Comamonadaceae bacterium]